MTGRSVAELPATVCVVDGELRIKFGRGLDSGEYEEFRRAVSPHALMPRTMVGGEVWAAVVSRANDRSSGPTENRADSSPNRPDSTDNEFLSQVSERAVTAAILAQNVEVALAQRDPLTSSVLQRPVARSMIAAAIKAIAAERLLHEYDGLPPYIDEASVPLNSRRRKDHE